VFVIDRGVQNQLGSEDYGMYYALFNFSYLFNILLDLGISNLNNKEIAQNPIILKKYFSGLFRIRILLFFLFVSTTFLFAVFLAYNSVELKMLALLCFNHFLSFTIIFLRTNISGKMMFKTDSFISVLDKTLVIVFCLPFLFIPVFQEVFTIQGFVLIQTITMLITVLVAAFFSLKSKEKKVFQHFNKTFVVAILKKSLPYASIVFLMVLFYRSNPFLIERLTENGKYLAGEYAKGTRVFDAFSMLGFLFVSILYPLFSRLLKQDSEDVKSILKVSTNFLIIPAVIVSAVCFYFSKEVLDLLHNENSFETIRAFSMVVLCVIPTSIIHIYGTLLTSNGNLKYLNITYLISCVLIYTLGVFLINKFSLFGASAVFLGTHVLVALSLIVYCFFNQNLKKVLDNLNGIRLVLFIIFSGIMTYSIKNMIELDWITQVAITVISIFILSIFLRLFSPMELLKILKSNPTD
jgi:O-antigen/teichoic acid export membrane protein